MTAPEKPTSKDGAPRDVTQLLVAWGNGSTDAGDELLAAVYAELHSQAARAMRREAVDHTLQATALVHEAYLRLIDQRRVQWRNRAQFFGVAAQLMRRILVDHARGRDAAKRGGGIATITLEDVDAAAERSTNDVVDILALHDAIEKLAALDPDQARVVELRYFGGMSIEETAEVMDISPATVKREWAVARAWLKRELGGE